MTSTHVGSKGLHGSRMFQGLEMPHMFTLQSIQHVIDSISHQVTLDPERVNVDERLYSQSRYIESSLVVLGCD